jgi:allophanate hydrolase
MNSFPYSLDVAGLQALYADGSLTPTGVVEEVWRRSEAWDDPALWIHRLPLADLRERARRVEEKGRSLQPLYGLPFAIKDNIDLEGVPTTAACPDFSRVPSRSAFVVGRLIEAGAIPVGKTNLDQFATGLVGVRSPHGTPRNPFHPAFAPGGSSSGSAVAVAAGLVSFALGTDTAGSGRVPAAFNNLVGLKPTRGWWSTLGVVPACRSLDCVSVFALSVGDAAAVAAVAGGFDPLDPYSRKEAGCKVATSKEDVADGRPAPFRFGVPSPSQMEWFGDAFSPALFAAATRRLESLAGSRVEIDFAPFRDAARLLYEGPWVAERWVAVREFHGRHAGSFLPITRQIIEQAGRYSASDAFAAQDRLQELRRTVEGVWERIDLLVLPTAAFLPTLAQIEADPVGINSKLGTYTNFTNLLDCAALAVPAGFRPDGLPFGISLIGPAWSDPALARVGAAFHRASDPTMGATGFRLPGEGLRLQPLASAAEADGSQPASLAAVYLQLAVVGAHLRGQPLNHQLTERGGRLVRADRTADCYRLYALAGTVPPKPGLVRGPAGTGGAIDLEIWELPDAAWADFVAAIPPPLGIGTLVLADGSTVKGFLCEHEALSGAEDITRHGGWAAYLRG